VTAMATATKKKNDGWGEGTGEYFEVTSASSTPPSSPDVPERDLFVPVLALVSLTGLSAAYLYESIRLYANGELYLPDWLAAVLPPAPNF